MVKPHTSDIPMTDDMRVHTSYIRMTYKWHTDDGMDETKFRNNTMACGCTTKIILIDGVIKLNFGIRMEYCIDCVLQILSLWMWSV